MKGEIIQKNSEILYLYDARLCNPNGDPDEENKPRMDYASARNLVSDVRLKRYLRDYWLSLDEGKWRAFGYEVRQDVWVRLGEEGERVSAKERIEELARSLTGKPAKQAVKEKDFEKKLLQGLVDVRLFGATIPIGAGEGERGEAKPITGAVQFTWGFSLNRVELVPSPTISSLFSGREEGEEAAYGTFGKDWRVKYAFLAFYGVVSAWRARHTGLTERDLQLLDHSMVHALPLIASTRSKVGQTPRLYLRLQYKDDRTLLGDLRSWVDLEEKEGLEDLNGVKFRYEKLLKRVSEARDRIERVVFWVHPDFTGGLDLREGLEKQGLKIESVGG